jgi:hypothetical protein
MDSEVVKIVRGVRDEIVANYYRMKLNASGEFAEKTQVIEDGGSIKIVAPAYIYQMEDGRPAGTMPPVSVIKKWIRDKNANAGTDIPESAAWAIAYVIKRDGITVPNEFNEGGVASSILTPELVKRVTVEINRIVSAKILTILTK